MSPRFVNGGSIVLGDGRAVRHSIVVFSFIDTVLMRSMEAMFPMLGKRSTFQLTPGAVLVSKRAKACTDAICEKVHSVKVRISENLTFFRHSSCQPYLPIRSFHYGDCLRTGLILRSLLKGPWWRFPTCSIGARCLRG